MDPETPEMPTAGGRQPMTTKTHYGALQLQHYLYRMIASELAHHAGNGSEWLFPDELSSAEQRKLVAMLEEVVTDFDVKAKDLGASLKELGKEPIP